MYQQMATNLRQAANAQKSVIRWLLDSDPSIRWQVMRDLIGARVEEIAAERARVATEGAGARLLALQGADGRWGGAAWNRGCIRPPGSMATARTLEVRNESLQRLKVR
jgi:hypothetical protein